MNTQELFVALNKLHFESKISKRDEDFVSSLLDYFSKRGFWSEKQSACVERLLERYATQAAAKAAPQETVRAAALFEMFASATQTLKFPSIKYTTKMETFRLWISTKDGSTLVIANNKHKPERRIFATVHNEPFGKQYPIFWQETFQRHPQFAELSMLVRAFIENPVEQAKLSGIAFSHCCFCGLELTDGRSVAAGYGPICAAKWNLPWGEGEQEEKDVMEF